jgi:endonuclease-3 related protein
VKARRLKELCRFLIDECGGRVKILRKRDTAVLREMLLQINGIGPETADSILIYALGKPVFVVDAYTRRIFSRHGLAGEDVSYDELQRLVHENFPASVKKLNQFHALLVEAAKRYCKKQKPLCSECPLGILLR